MISAAVHMSDVPKTPVSIEGSSTGYKLLVAFTIVSFAAGVFGVIAACKFIPPIGTQFLQGEVGFYMTVGGFGGSLIGFMVLTCQGSKGSDVDTQTDAVQVKVDSPPPLPLPPEESEAMPERHGYVYNPYPVTVVFPKGFPVIASSTLRMGLIPHVTTANALKAHLRKSYPRIADWKIVVKYNEREIVKEDGKYLVSASQGQRIDENMRVRRNDAIAQVLSITATAVNSSKPLSEMTKVQITLQSGETFKIDMENTQKVKDLMGQIAERTGVSPDEQRLRVNGQLLHREVYIADLQLQGPIALNVSQIKITLKDEFQVQVQLSYYEENWATKNIVAHFKVKSDTTIGDLNKMISKKYSTNGPETLNMNLNGSWTSSSKTMADLNLFWGKSLTLNCGRTFKLPKEEPHEPDDSSSLPVMRYSKVSDIRAQIAEKTKVGGDRLRIMHTGIGMLLEDGKALLDYERTSVSYDSSQKRYRNYVQGTEADLSSIKIYVVGN